MDILLIQPGFIKSRRYGDTHCGLVPPMMLYYLAKPLREKGFDVDVLDLSTYVINDFRFKEYLLHWKPRIVGITSVTENSAIALKIAKWARFILPSAFIVMGGPHVTFLAEETLRNEYIDFVVRGEGDLSFTDLAECLLRHDRKGLDGIAGISYRDSEKFIHQDKELIQNVDKLGFPSRDRMNPDRYIYSAVIMGSRGCPFKCHFCSAAAMTGGKYRMRSIDNILDELDYLIGFLHHRRFTFADDTITADPRRIERICGHILNRGYVTEWVCASRVDVVSNKLLLLMAKAGCRSIQFGFESGNEDVLKSINKKITPDQIIRATELCVRNRIVPYGNFIIGFPEDTPATIQDTYRLALKIKKMNGTCDFAVMTPFPGTYFYEHAEELGLIIHTRNWSEYLLDNPVISTRHLDRDELRMIYADCRSGLAKCESRHPQTRYVTEREAN